MFRQLLICFVILVVAAIGWYMFVPGAEQSLAKFGINLPVAPVTGSAPQNASTPGGGGNPGGGGPGGQQQAAVPNGGPGGGNGGFGGGNRPTGGAGNPGAGGQGGQGGAGGQGGGRPGGGFGGPGGGFGGAARTSTVVTSAVTLATINDTLSAIGEGTAAHSVTVLPPAGGTLEELLVSPGDTVDAGTVIGRLDSSTEQIALDRAKLAVADTAAALQRQQGLADNSLVTSAALSEAKLAADNAELDLRNAQNAFDKRNIVSPIKGTVGLMQVTPGNYVAASDTVTTIDDNTSILVNFWVPERYAATLQVGMPVTVTAVALPGRTFEGTVSAVDNRIDTESRTLQVQASIPNEENSMRAGMSFSVAMKFPGEQFPAVNPLAIQWSSDGAFVWTYSAEATAHKVMVDIIQRNSDGVLVKGELQQGDPVITEGVLQLSEGAKLTLLEGPSAREAQTDTPAANGGTPADAKAGPNTPAAQG